MIDNPLIIAALDSWLTGVIPDLDGRTYDYAPSGKPKGLPDASIILLRQSLQTGASDDFPFTELQQVRCITYDVGISFMVDAGTDDAAERNADVQLRLYADTILRNLAPDGWVLDVTGGNVLIAPAATMDYATPFAEYEDGTRGREATLTITVAQLL